MMMENSSDFIFAFLGLVKIGAVPAFLNYNLREKSLVHCIKIVNPVAILLDVEVREILNDPSLQVTHPLLFSVHVCDF